MTQKFIYNSTINLSQSIFLFYTAFCTSVFIVGKSVKHHRRFYLNFQSNKAFPKPLKENGWCLFIILRHSLIFALDLSTLRHGFWMLKYKPTKSYLFWVVQIYSKAKNFDGFVHIIYVFFFDFCFLILVERFRSIVEYRQDFREKKVYKQTLKQVRF